MELAQDEQTVAVYAERAGLPRILPRVADYPSENAAQYPPPSLDKFRTKESRAPVNAAPMLWYWQMTGKEWNRESHSYQVCFLDPQSQPNQHSTQLTFFALESRAACEKDALEAAEREPREGAWA